MPRNKMLQLHPLIRRHLTEPDTGKPDDLVTLTVLSDPHCLDRDIAYSPEVPVEQNADAEDIDGMTVGALVAEGKSGGADIDNVAADYVKPGDCQCLKFPRYSKPRLFSSFCGVVPGSHCDPLLHLKNILSIKIH